MDLDESHEPFKFGDATTSQKNTGVFINNLDVRDLDFTTRKQNSSPIIYCRLMPPAETRLRNSFSEP